MIQLIDIQITSTCNRNCYYCYGPCKQKGKLGTDSVLNLINQMDKHNIRNISISGGEPLLHNNILEILQYAKRKKFNISLSTNTDFLLRNPIILEYIDVIGIPLEAGTESIHDNIRGKGSFRNIINSINYITNKKNISIRVGTVINEKNINQLMNIAKLINKYPSIKLWKLYEEINYYKTGYKEYNRTNLFSEIPQELFDVLEFAVLRTAKRIERSKGYFIVEPDGEVFIPLLKENYDDKIYIGNINSSSLDKIIRRWELNHNIINHTNMYQDIFKGE